MLPCVSVVWEKRVYCISRKGKIQDWEDKEICHYDMLFGDGESKIGTMEVVAQKMSITKISWLL
jgi:hypothetical protein